MAGICTQSCHTIRCRGAGFFGAAWEFEELTVRMVFRVACVVVVALGAAALYAHRNAAPACDSDAAQGQVFRALHDQFHLEGVYLHDFTTISGGLFSGARDCLAEAAEIRGNIDAADLAPADRALVMGGNLSRLLKLQ